MSECKNKNTERYFELKIGLRKLLGAFNLSVNRIKN
jgi:hypothetical protein